MATKTKNKLSTRAKAKLYKWGGSSFPVPAQVVGEELERMKVNGSVTARDVLEAARDPANVLHGCWDWDVEKAAEEHWIGKARQLIRSIVEVKTSAAGKRTKQFAFVHVTDADGPRYVDVDHVASDDEIRDAAIEEALTQVEGLKRRYEFITELRPIFQAADRVFEKTKRKSR